MRVLMWVQHLLGTGHTVRAAALARALLPHGEVTLILGAPPPPTLDLSGLSVRLLPPIMARDASFDVVEGLDGTPYDTLAPIRRRLIEEAIAEVAPTVVITETFPLGRRMLAPELTEPLQSLRHPGGPLIAASVRDVLTRKGPEKEAIMMARANALFDLVLCHGDPAFVPVIESFPSAAALGERLVYTGYVDAGTDGPPIEDAAGEVVVSSGGGRSEDGLTPLVREAAACTPSLSWRMLSPRPASVGPMPPNVRVEANRPDFRALLRRAAVSVSRCGYNTFLDVAAAGCRAVFVPFADFGETEQTDRATALAARGFARLVPTAAGGAALAEAVEGALAEPTPVLPPLSRDGARRSAEAILDAVRARAIA